jgi:hypothetical protein
MRDIGGPLKSGRGPWEFAGTAGQLTGLLPVDIIWERETSEHGGVTGVGKIEILGDCCCACVSPAHNCDSRVVEIPARFDIDHESDRDTISAA